MSFSNLSAAETERLAKLAEECAEVIQVVGKVLVHGFDGKHPRRPEQGTNREHLEEEIGHIQHIVFMMTQRGDLDPLAIGASRAEKAMTIHQYLHHQGEL